MDVISAPVKCLFAIEYIDDIFTLYRTTKQHLSHRGKVLRLPMDADMTLLLKEYNFLWDFNEYFGHVVAFCKLLVTQIPQKPL